MIIQIEKMPESLEEFERFKTAFPLTVPENVCTLFLCALSLYLHNNQEGITALDELRGPRSMNGFDKQFIRDRLRGKEYLPLAYFDGASPDNNYKPDQPYRLEVLSDPRSQDVESGYTRRYLRTTGADSPRPVKLRQKGGTGEWFLWEYSSILSGIRTPVSADPWA